MFGFLKSVGAWLFGGGGADKAVTLVDKAFYTSEEQARDTAGDLAAARAYAPGGRWDSVIDKWHRAIRPTLATWAALILIGIIPPPAHWASIPAPVWQLVVLIVSFYFGGRAILKDIPNAVRLLRER